MQMSDIPFGTTDWSTVERTEHHGETGTAYWHTRTFGQIRVRLGTSGAMTLFHGAILTAHCQESTEPTAWDLAG